MFFYPILPRLLRISRVTLYQWIAERDIETCQIAPHTIRVKRSALAAFLHRYGLEIRDCKEGLLLLDEVANLLRIHKTNVSLLEKSGELELVRFSEKRFPIRISRRALDRYLRSKGLGYEDVSLGPLMLLVEVAELLRVDLATIYTWRKRGFPKVVYLSPQNVRVSRLYLDNFLQEQGSSLAEFEQEVLTSTEYAC